jgi:hypothetical protein
MHTIYRLGPPLPPTFHRDPLTPTVKQYFDVGAFYAVGTMELANTWKDMGDTFKNRPIFEIGIKDTATVVFYKGWSETEKIATDLTETTYSDWGNGPEIDPEECQLVVMLKDVISVKRL